MRALIALFFMGLAAVLSANSATLGPPGNKGLDINDSERKNALRQAPVYGMGDCSLGAAATVVSYTSSVVNATSTAGINWTTNKYSGILTLYVVNTGKSSLVAYGSMTATTIVSATPSGAVILAGQGTTLTCQARDGFSFHLQGLTATTTANYGVCTH